MRRHGLRADRRQQLVDDALGLSIGLDTFESEELLSMGQSRLVLAFDHDCEQSIFLSGPDRGDSIMEPLRRLALYDVAHNYLGLEEALWPISDPCSIFDLWRQL